MLNPMVLVLLTMSSLAFATGCATTASSGGNYLDYLRLRCKTSYVAPNSANIYLVRRIGLNPRALSRATVDDGLEGFLASSAYLLLVEAPGDHTIRVTIRVDSVEHEAKLRSR